MKISPNFSREEFVCRCGICGSDGVDVELIKVLEELRDHFGGVPVTITSGFRCHDHNIAVGGAGGSQHLIAKAADIILAGIPPESVYVYLHNRYPDKYGVGDYRRWTHIDVREKKARW